LTGEWHDPFLLDTFIAAALIEIHGRMKEGAGGTRSG
jgi:hypothetical protein